MLQDGPTTIIEMASSVLTQRSFGKRLLRRCWPPRWLPRARRGLGSGRVPVLRPVGVAFALRGPLRASLLVPYLVPVAGASLGSAVHLPVPEAVLGVARLLYRTLPRADELLGQSAWLLYAP